jgi:carnitine O-acetyltransferase
MQYSSWAADAQGVDRHLFGLKRCLKEGEPVPEIYNDESFAKSNHWELSTSQLSSPYLDGWGYGEGGLNGDSISHLTAHSSSYSSRPGWLWVVVFDRR